MITKEEYFIIKKLDCYVNESGKLEPDINNVKIFDCTEDAFKAIKYYIGFNVTEEARLFKVLKVTRESTITEIETPKVLAANYIKETSNQPILSERKYFADPTAITNKMDIVKSEKGIWRKIVRFLSPLDIIKKTL